MSFHDYFLKCESQEQADTLLESAGLQVASDDDYPPADGVSIYHVGVISTGGEWDDEGNEVVAPVLLDGWHVNLRLRDDLTAEQLAVLAGSLVTPDTPRVIFG
jgi:hypothetical protein